MMYEILLFASFNALFIIMGTFIQPSYQQSVAATTNMMRKDLTFCMQNHTMSNTLQTFWRDANGDCELEPIRLLQLYSQLLEASVAKEDQCSALLKHQIRKKLIRIVATQLEEAFIMQSMSMNREMKLVLNRLQEIDWRVSLLIWERVVSEVLWFVAAEEIVNEVVQLKEHNIQIAVFEILFNKNLYLHAEHSETLLPLLTFHTVSLIGSQTSAVAYGKRLQRLYRRLPKELRFLYESSQRKIGLLNYQQFEYLYAPRDNGPDSDRRLPLTWIETKNSTDSDGHLMIRFNDDGLVAFGNQFGASLKYLYADVQHNAVYFWIGPGVKSSQWWQLLWPHESYVTEVAGYILLQNDVTKDLLCATTEYDENRRYVTLLNAKKNMENAACYWLVTGF